MFSLGRGFSFCLDVLLLMEEILHQLGCIKPCTQCETTYQNDAGFLPSTVSSLLFMISCLFLSLFLGGMTVQTYMVKFFYKHQVVKLLVVRACRKTGGIGFTDNYGHSEKAVLLLKNNHLILWGSSMRRAVALEETYLDAIHWVLHCSIQLMMMMMMMMMMLVVLVVVKFQKMIPQKA